MSNFRNLLTPSLFLLHVLPLPSRSRVHFLYWQIAPPVSALLHIGTSVPLVVVIRSISVYIATRSGNHRSRNVKICHFPIAAGQETADAAPEVDWGGKYRARYTGPGIVETSSLRPTDIQERMATR